MPPKPPLRKTATTPPPAVFARCAMMTPRSGKIFCAAADWSDVRVKSPYHTKCGFLNSQNRLQGISIFDSILRT
jgi:hypothetical protein